MADSPTRYPAQCGPKSCSRRLMDQVRTLGDKRADASRGAMVRHLRFNGCRCPIEHKIAILNGNLDAIPIDPWHLRVKYVARVRRLDINVRSDVGSLPGRLRELTFDSLEKQYSCLLSFWFGAERLLGSHSVLLTNGNFDLLRLSLFCFRQHNLQDPVLISCLNFIAVDAELAASRCVGSDRRTARFCSLLHFSSLASVRPRW